MAFYLGVAIVTVFLKAIWQTISLFLENIKAIKAQIGDHCTTQLTLAIFVCASIIGFL
jgi:hypothetical protein